MKENIVVSASRRKGYWHLRVKYDENNHRIRYQKSTTLTVETPFRLVEQARRRVLAELYEVNRMDRLCEKWEVSPELRYQPVSQWLGLWLEERRDSIAECTATRYAIIVRHACRFFDEKGIELCKISPLALEEYRDEMLVYGYSSRTIQAHFVLLRSAFQAACNCGLNRSNPVCGIPFPRVERSIPRPYSVAEQRQLLEAVQGTELHLPVLLALLYGMRRGEVCGLCWEDIDWDNKQLSVRHNAMMVHDESGRGRVICSEKLKTTASYRSFPLHPQVEQLLRERQPRRLSGPVFEANHGGPINPSCLTGRFQHFLKARELRHIRFHDLRHTCATSLAQRGCETTDIQAYMGHSNPITTSRYIHPEIGGNARSLKCLERALSLVS